MEDQMTVFVLFGGEGKYVDIDEFFSAGIEIGDNASDEQVLTAVAQFVDRPRSALRGYVVDRSADGLNLTVRPQEKFA